MPAPTAPRPTANWLAAPVGVLVAELATDAALALAELAAEEIEALRLEATELTDALALEATEEIEEETLAAEEEALLAALPVTVVATAPVTVPELEVALPLLAEEVQVADAGCERQDCVSQICTYWYLKSEGSIPRVMKPRLDRRCYGHRPTQTVDQRCHTP